MRRGSTSFSRSTCRVPCWLRTWSPTDWRLPRRWLRSSSRADADDRIGLVVFAGEAFTQVPLTLDYSVVTDLLGQMEVGMIEDGTAVGMGLATAVKRLQASDAESQVVVLLTDGRSNRGEIGPVTAGQMAQALGVRVYTIGAGSQGMTRMPIDDRLRGRRYVNVEVDIDEASLTEVAETTGGRYFRATDRESLSRIYEEIDDLENHGDRSAELHELWGALPLSSRCRSAAFARRGRPRPDRPS